LRWQSVGQLTPKDYYVISAAYMRYGAEWYEVHWTKETSWLISDKKYLLDLSDDGRFRWAVRVMERTDQFDKNGKPIGLPRSPLSEVWTFEWKRSSDSGPAPTPVLPPP
jgi:hypothetical protein